MRDGRAADRRTPDPARLAEGCEVLISSLPGPAEVGVEITALDAIRDAYRRAAERGWGELTSYAVVRLAEEAAGTPLRSDVFQSLPGGTA